jgi:hypothetical protein
MEVEAPPDYEIRFEVGVVSGPITAAACGRRGARVKNNYPP